MIRLDHTTKPRISTTTKAALWFSSFWVVASIFTLWMVSLTDEGSGWTVNEILRGALVSTLIGGIVAFPFAFIGYFWFVYRRQ